jgi:hypothetical protein
MFCAIAVVGVEPLDDLEAPASDCGVHDAFGKRAALFSEPLQEFQIPGLGSCGTRKRIPGATVFSAPLEQFNVAKSNTGYTKILLPPFGDLQSQWKASLGVLKEARESSRRCKTETRRPAWAVKS